MAVFKIAKEDHAELVTHEAEALSAGCSWVAHCVVMELQKIESEEK